MTWADWRRWLREGWPPCAGCGRLRAELAEMEARLVTALARAASPPVVRTGPPSWDEMKAVEVRAARRAAGLEMG